MSLADYDSSVCSIARTTQLIGDRWSLLIVRDVFNGVRRFDALADHLGIARDILTRRLANLVDAGLLERRAYRVDGARERHEYVLTVAGLDLRPVMVALMDWGDRHLADAAGPPMALVHECGAEVHARLVCDAGHEVGPDARARLQPLDGAARR